MNGLRRLRYCVNNEWRESKTTKYMPVTNSSTGEVMAEAPCCTVDEVNNAVTAAKVAFPAWSSTPIQDRMGVMFHFRNLLESHMEDLTLSVAMELGKNLGEARGDVIKAMEVVEMACGAPILMQGDALMNISTGHDTVMYREPLGVFAGIVPFNFPAMIPFGWMIPLCITLGNTFVLKAASLTPMTAMRVLELLIEAGMPKGVVNLVTCSRNEAELLLKHPDVRGISYVGSTAVGLHIYSTAAAHGKRVQALCEAKNHGLVLRDAALERSALGIINSTFGCAGMRCMALPVLCVEEACADEFISYLVKFAKQRKVGCAYHQETDLGPVVSAEHKESVINWINKGVEEGADLILDGRNIVVADFENGHFIGPTIFDHVKPGMSVGDSEIFGPVTCIKRVKDFEEGLSIMNGSRFANGSCIFTQSGYYAREFVRRTHGGMVGVNVGIPVPVSYFPFAGHKDSFFGDLHVMGRDGVAFYTESKCVTSRWFSEEDKKETCVGTWEGTITRK
ncbi:MAG: CoA-acylating methylmalonate-semialdehyde dehydrogenase [Deltaproteobacteria bacterium]|nr:CoA-acylating methylmalonate-semialdehyde dehydrogenase [Deltaproteobacteria bacterium]